MSAKMIPDRDRTHRGLGIMVEAALRAMLRRIADRRAFETAEPQRFIGREFDVIAEPVTPERWSRTRRQAVDALRSIRPRFKLGVLSMARNEAPILSEWIEHHLAIGADRLFIYSNDNTDGTDALLRWFALRAPVTPLFTSAAPGVNVQLKNYQHAFFLLPELRLYEWVLMIDADEFLVPAARFDCRLPTLLDAAPADTDAILFPWLWRLWDRSFERGPGLLTERYPHAIHHSHFKSVFRLGRATGLTAIHMPNFEHGATIRDSGFASIPPDRIWTHEPKNLEGGWINHYWGRSFEEFVVKKWRSDAIGFPRALETFFAWTAEATPANVAPTPAPMLKAFQRERARFEADPSYGDIAALVEARYATHAQALRNDPTLLSLYNRLNRTIPPASDEHQYFAGERDGGEA